jgi:hypothetical protein
VRATVAVSGPGGNDHRRVGPNCDVAGQGATHLLVSKTGKKKPTVDARESDQEEGPAASRSFAG